MAKFSRLTVLAFLTLGLSLSSCTKKDETADLVMGFNPAESAEVVEANGKALAALIREKTGLNLKTFVSTDIGGLVEAMRSGKVHLAFMPPFSFIQAERVAGAKVLLKAVRKGRAVNYSTIITAKGHKSLQDLKGKSMAWIDPASTTGHIIPKNELMDMGIDPDTFFGKQVFAGGHDALVLSVVNKTVDAGATLCNDPECKDGIWMQFLKDPEKLKEIKPLHISKPIPGDTLTTTEKFYNEKKDVVEKVVALLQELHKTPEGKKMLMDLYHIDSMVPATREEYEPLRSAAKRLNIGNN
ncbi:MAG: phosphate/phosphite/phosphonate ABC transporter substrate-binding protein [Bdellovibrionota bacterium]